MDKIKVDTIIFDFDSTVIRGELLEIIAQIKFANNPLKSKMLAQIQEITNAGMEGKIPFSESLDRRLKLLKITKDLMGPTIEKIKELINQEYLEILPNLVKKNIYIVSGGYKNIIEPLNTFLQIPKDNIFAIQLFFEGNNYSHFDKNTPLVETNGKAQIAKQIKNKGKTLMVGDGMTDYLVKELGGADYFIAYVGVVKREPVCRKADFVIKNMHELSSLIE